LFSLSPQYPAQLGSIHPIIFRPRRTFVPTTSKTDSKTTNQANPIQFNDTMVQSSKQQISNGYIGEVCEKQKNKCRRSLDGALRIEG